MTRWIAISIALTCASLAGMPAEGQSLTPSQRAELATWYHSASRRAPGDWGIAIANQRGELLWSVAPSTSLIPASTVKVFTTGFARTVLGGEQ